ncbi:pseudouridine synthase [Flavobacteriales bacterium]|nr:pseudouridine synthase [Flavobacteriales bacterium]MDB4493763.1 pseudouridine synthase [Flavobacteriales bacterium]
MNEGSEGTRINKYFTQVGYCSRRAADKLIEDGAVKINGVVPLPGTKVMPDDVVTVHGIEVKNNDGASSVYIALNKPVGIVCTTDTKREKDNIIDFIKYPTRIFPVGRLDKMSEGLILLTDDGSIVNHILRERNGHEKEYIVTLNRPFDEEFIETMSTGVSILDTFTRPCRVTRMASNQFKIVLVQGLNRQIRRMCEALGHRVIRLKRIRIMSLELDTAPGKWRPLTEKEVRKLRGN